ncbi:hypothetical protein, partial [Catenibacterium sp.]|uniref:hypothetical protein n=1 Tax=Catenibacterium sp. TaxID=2049022 RepID=UPI002E75D2E7
INVIIDNIYINITYSNMKKFTMVILDYLKKLWNFISSLTSETKTIIIFILLIIILNPIPRSYYEETLSNVMKK